MSLAPTTLLNGWQHDEFFEVPRPDTDFGVIDRVEQYVVDIHLENHPFFELAATRIDVLHIWLSQELVMTNAFSQAVMYACSQIRNVHVRASLASVAYGEHGRVRKGVAKGAHPALLDALRETAQLPAGEVHPLEPTVALIGLLCASLDEPLEALATIGIGNERLIFPEYEAIWTCFEKVLPDAAFQRFLKANLGEDEVHTDLCRDAARQLIRSEADAQRYEQAAQASVDARWTYFDGLLAIANGQG